VINTNLGNLHPISHRFKVITDYWSNLSFNTLVRGKLWTQNHEIWPKKLETSPYRTVQNAFWYPEPFRRRSRVWQMSGCY